MKAACTIIFQNSQGDILLHLRDNKPEIPDPNMWDLPGGWCEEDETPEQTIVREMQEEMELDLKNPNFFKTYQWSDHTQHIFYKKMDLDPRGINLHEGQMIKYFRPEIALTMKLANTGHKVLTDFIDHDF